MMAPNRYLCSVLEEMRDCCKTNNFSYLPGLIEEVQSMGSRMEASLYDKRDLSRVEAELEKARKKLEKTEKRIEEKKANIKRLKKETAEAQAIYDEEIVRMHQFHDNRRERELKEFEEGK